jgi:hypothetical protein
VSSSGKRTSSTRISAKEWEATEGYRRRIDYVHPFDRPQAAQAMDVGGTPPTGLLSWRWPDIGEGKNLVI